MEQNNKLNLSITELNKIQKRFNQELTVIQKHLDFLDRSYEECWAYPDSEEKSEQYSTSIINTENKKEEIEKIIEDIDNLKTRVSSLMRYK